MNSYYYAYYTYSFLFLLYLLLLLLLLRLLLLLGMGPTGEPPFKSDRNACCLLQVWKMLARP